MKTKKTEKTPLDILKEARAIIAKEGAWLQGWLAQDAKGKIMGPTNPDATCFCAVGAIMAAAQSESATNMASRTAWNMLGNAVRSATPDDPVTVATFNDAPETTQADVVAMFDAAISAAEEATGLGTQCSAA